jgi:hypothetical protein
VQTHPPVQAAGSRTAAVLPAKQENKVSKCSSRVHISYFFRRKSYYSSIYYKKFMRFFARKNVGTIDPNVTSNTNM